MRPDLANTGLIEVTDELISFRYRTDRVVHNECRPYIVSLKNRLYLPQTLYRSYAGGAPRARSDPVEFGSGIHHNRQHRLLGHRPSDEFANTSINHGESCPLPNRRRSRPRYWFVSTDIRQIPGRLDRYFLCS